MPHFFNLIKFITAIALFSCATSAFGHGDDFVNHVVISPGQSFTVNYTFPGIYENMYCKEDDKVNKLASVEYTYQNVSFKSQLNSQHYFIMSRANSVGWEWVPFGVAGEESGTLIFTNLDKTDLTVSCYYYAPSAPSESMPF